MEKRPSVKPAISLYDIVTIRKTRDLAESYTKSFGQRGAARKLTERGYKSPTGKPISRGHIYKILNGEEICFQEPEAPPEQKPIEPPAPEWQPKPLLGHSEADNFNAFTPEEQRQIADNKALAEQKRQELLDEIEEEEAEEEEASSEQEALAKSP